MFDQVGVDWGGGGYTKGRKRRTRLPEVFRPRVCSSFLACTCAEHWDSLWDGPHKSPYTVTKTQYEGGGTRFDSICCHGYLFGLDWCVSSPRKYRGPSAPYCSARSAWTHALVAAATASGAVSVLRRRLNRLHQLYVNICT